MRSQKDFEQLQEVINNPMFMYSDGKQDRLYPNITCKPVCASVRREKVINMNEDPSVTNPYEIIRIIVNFLSSKRIHKKNKTHRLDN